MKRLFLFLICCGAVALTSCAKDDPDTAKKFPDARFREYLRSYGFEEIDGDIDPNSETNKALIPYMITLNIYYDVSSLKGIEYFTALTRLGCSGNQISTLDLSKNTALVELQCANNQLKTLDLSKNTALTTLWCHGNQLTILNVSKNTALTELHCQNNRLSALDLWGNRDLRSLYCSGNQLSELSLWRNTDLRSLYCSQNQLSELDLSKNIELDILQCHRNQLSTLDVSMLSQLSGYTLCGDQQPDKELTLRLTSAQNSKWTFFDQRDENIRIKKVITD